MKRVLAAAAFLIGLAMPIAASHAGELYIISRCAPISLLTGLIPEDPFSPSSPLYVDGKLVGNLRVCDAVRTTVAPGKHKIRVKLFMPALFGGIGSDEGMEIIADQAPVYVVMYDNYFNNADAVDPKSGREFLTNVRSARGK